MASHVAVIFEDVQHSCETREKDALLACAFELAQQFVKEDHLARIRYQVLTKLFCVFVLKVVEHVRMVADLAQLHEEDVEDFLAAVDRCDVPGLQELLVDFELHLREFYAYIDLDFIGQLVFEVFLCAPEHERTHDSVQHLYHFQLLVLAKVLRSVVLIRVQVEPRAEVILA